MGSGNRTRGRATGVAPLRVRREMPDPRLDEAEFKRRFLAQYPDAAFGAVADELARVAAVAWDAYTQARKSAVTRKAGAGFADPDYELSVEWIAARDAIERAQRAHDDPHAPSCVLLINGASRSEHTCPGESSKSYRLLTLARAVLQARPHTRVEVLDLSRLAAEYGRRIHPCKTCFSTSPALCHWPCSCYPNYGLGQTQDWMNEIYPLWVAAHGIMILTPVNWFHGSSPLKLMMDRLVCADGGNPDPTSTHGKDALTAKKIELAGWAYPRHLHGRLFACVVHGDAEGAQSTRRALCDWLSAMKLMPAGAEAALDRYIGYWQPYASSHDELDADEAVQQEVRNAALVLLEAIQHARAGCFAPAGTQLAVPRDK
jgi:multimeric flavodoxin WrbA